MDNPNNKSAHIYDIAYRSLRPPYLTDEEVTLITSNFDKNSHVLDVGGGTGRHSVPLSNMGYDVTVVDSSLGMINNLQEKINKLKLNTKAIGEDIFETKLKKDYYDIAILFWNSFNEIALNKKQAIKLLEKLKQSLKENGVILINIDDAHRVDPSNFDFTTSYLSDGLEYKVHWETAEYFKKSNTSISKEVIQVFDNKSKLVEEVISFIKQKYWKIEEINEICNTLNLKVQKFKVKSNDELYLVITK